MTGPGFGPGLDGWVITKATDSLDTSVADVTATLGNLQVGSLDLGVVDLIDIRLLEETTSVSDRDGGIVSDAAFTGIGIDIAALDLSGRPGVRPL